MRRVAAAACGLTLLLGAGPAGAADPTQAPLLIFTSPTTGKAYFLTGPIATASFTRAASAEERGAAFWREYGHVFGVDDPSSELELRAERSEVDGVTHLRYDQRYHGLPVFGTQLVVHLRGDEVLAANGRFAGGLSVPTVPTISATAASWAAARGVQAGGRRQPRGSPELLVYVDSLGRGHLAWRVTLTSSEPLGLWLAFVDALTGDVLRSYNDLHTARNRTTHTNQNNPNCNTNAAPLCVLPGTLVRDEDDPPVADEIVEDTHVNTGAVYDYFFSTFERDSFDDLGHELRSTVHFGHAYNNAFWCPDDCAAAFGSAIDGEQMVYGDGNGGAFLPLGQDRDVVAHELAHAVTEYANGLEYLDQSGALNESYSDVFAAMTDDANGTEWQIGEHSFTPFIDGDALRYMDDPSRGFQPAHMNEFVNTWFDSGGVHTNSGIPNHAAYLAATHPNYGIGRAALQEIYYAAMFCLSANADFLENLGCLLLAAEVAFPGDAAKARAITYSQAAVGIAAVPEVLQPNGGETLTAGQATSVTWDGGQATGQSFETSYRLSDPIDYREDFESFFPPPGLSVGGDQPFGFSPVTEPVVGGVWSMRSGSIPNDGRSELRWVVHLQDASVINFRRLVSSQDFDLLSFHVDGFPVGADWGLGTWGQASYMPILLPAGTHRLVWVYEKDFSDIVPYPGADAAFVDNIDVSNLEYEAPTVIGTTAPDATSQSWTPPDEPGSGYRVRVRRIGIAPWLAFDESDGTFEIAGAPPPPPPAGPPPPPPAGPPPPPPPPPPPVVRPPVARCVVPNVKGKTVPAARTALARARCALGRVSRAYSRRVRKSRIISQSRRAASRHPRGTRVNVVVSRGRRR